MIMIMMMMMLDGVGVVFPPPNGHAITWYAALWMVHHGLFFSWQTTKLFGWKMHFLHMSLFSLANIFVCVCFSFETSNATSMYFVVFHVCVCYNSNGTYCSLARYTCTNYENIIIEHIIKFCVLLYVITFKCVACFRLWYSSARSNRRSQWNAIVNVTPCNIIAWERFDGGGKSCVFWYQFPSSGNGL